MFATVKATYIYGTIFFSAKYNAAVFYGSGMSYINTFAECMRRENYSEFSALFGFVLPDFL